MCDKHLSDITLESYLADNLQEAAADLYMCTHIGNFFHKLLWHNTKMSTVDILATRILEFICEAYAYICLLTRF